MLSIVGSGPIAVEVLGWAQASRPAMEAVLVDPDETGGPPRSYVLAVRDPSWRQHLDAQLSALGWEPMSLVHPTATIGNDVELGLGTVVGPGCRMTTNVRVGRHARFEPTSTISHDNRVGSWVTVGCGSNVAGTCVIGDRAVVGTGATLRQAIRVGADAVVEAGAVVVDDVASGERVAGVPARLIGPRSTSPVGGGR